MTNEEHILLIPTEQLAELLIRPIQQEEYDEDWDGNTVYAGLTDLYRTSDGFDFMFFEDAVEHEIEWLKEEYREELPQ